MADVEAQRGRRPVYSNEFLASYAAELSARRRAMIPVQTQRSVETSPTVASASFGISQNDVAHILTMLRDNLYSDRVLAVLRVRSEMHGTCIAGGGRATYRFRSATYAG